MSQVIEWKEYEQKFIAAPHDAYTRRMLQDVVDDYEQRGMDNDPRRIAMYKAALGNFAKAPTQIYADPQPQRRTNSLGASGTGRRSRCGASERQKAWMLNMIVEIADQMIVAQYTDKFFAAMPWGQDDTKGTVGWHITRLKNRLAEVRGQRAAEKQAQEAQAQEEQAQALAKPKSQQALVIGGIYVLAGNFYRIVQSQVGRMYAKVWDGDGWNYANGAIRRLTSDMVATTEDAKRWKDLYNNCVFCHRPLARDESEKVGYGPDCAEKHGLPWG